MDYSSSDNNFHREYVEALEEERRKIHVFRRELPLCFHLVSQAIDVCRRRQTCGSWMMMMDGDVMRGGVGPWECSDEQNNTGTDCHPLLEQFIPVKGSSSVCDGEEEEEEEEERSSASHVDDEKPSTKLDWLRSVRLWNQNSDPSTTNEGDVKNSVCNKWEKSRAATVESCSTETVGEEEGGNVRRRGEKGEESAAAAAAAAAPRKSRRCWSPDLHRCFLNALHQLGGAHVATPKQIREVMKVEGLTNDEVKSHLQKFRLHKRKPSSPPSVNNGKGDGESGAQQFVLVKRVWSPHGEPDDAHKPFRSILNTRLHNSDSQEPGRGHKCPTSPDTSLSTPTSITTSHPEL